MSTKQILRSYRYQIIGVKIYFLTIIIIIIIIIKIWFDEQTDRQPGWCGVRWETKGSFPSTQYILYTYVSVIIITIAIILRTIIVLFIIISGLLQSCSAFDQGWG